jgi:LPS-assembly protein
MGSPVLRMDRTFMATEPPAQGTPSFVEADKLEGKKENQLEATGNAILRKRGQSIRADRLLYFQDTQDVDAQGSVVLEQGGNTISGPHLKLNLDTSIGTMEKPIFYLYENDGRGSADVMHIQDKQHYTLDNATYTTCPADNQDWLLKMSGLELDRDRQVGTAHHAWIEFMGAPILYSPWMNFPLSKERKSGLMSPIIGNTITNGREITVPYYWNIAPNRDATIAPRVMSNRGVMLYNEFRYLESAYGGEVHFDFLTDDRIAKRKRGYAGLQHSQHIGGGFYGYINLNSVSDDNYYRDLANSTELTSQSSLLQDIMLSHNASWWNASARVQRHQSLIPNSTPYKRLPQLTLNANQVYANANLMLASEYVDFSHPTALNAKRLAVNASASYPLVNDSAFYLTPKVGLRSTHYGSIHYQNAQNIAGTPSNVSRTLPLFSVDSGVSLERETSLFGGNYLHTLEPRAFYVYVPYKNQDSLPVFDSGQAGFDFTQIFSEHRFVGNDRVGDANHITLALSSRLLEQENGRERLMFMVGERFSFKTPQVNLIAPTTTTNKSDILLAASGQVTDALNFSSGLQYDPHFAHTQNYNVTAQYRPETGKTLNLGYRFARNTLRQIDLSAQWPLSDHWHGIAHWNYSIQDGKTLESIAGVEYNESCWTFRVVAQRFVVASHQANTGIFMQLELNDLVSVGVDALSAIKRHVPNYIKLNEISSNKSSSVLR